MRRVNPGCGGWERWDREEMRRRGKIQFPNRQDWDADSEGGATATAPWIHKIRIASTTELYLWLRAIRIILSTRHLQNLIRVTQKPRELCCVLMVFPIYGTA